MKRILTPSLRLLHYTGQFPRKVVEVIYHRTEKPPILENGDYLLLDTATAIRLNAKYSYFRLIETEEAEEILSLDDNTFEAPTELEDIVIVPKYPAPIDLSKIDIEKQSLTIQNIKQADIKDIKAECKKHKITIGKLKRDDLIALLMPYLED